MTEKRFNKLLQKEQKRNEQFELSQTLKQEREKRKKKKIETSKLLALYLFILLNIIVLYSLIAMWHFADLTYLGVLISDIAAQVITYAIYCVKAYKGKQSEEELKFEREKWEEVNQDYPLEENLVKEDYKE